MRPPKDKRPAPKKVPLKKAPVKKADDEVKYYGEHACLSLITQRREATIRAYVTEAQLPRFKKYLQWCAKTRRAYHVVTEAELEKICQSVHHEGVCILTKARPSLDVPGLLRVLGEDEGRADKAPLLYLAGTGNPHNIGAIMRSAAHFGVRYILVDRAGFPQVGGAMARVSKGGCEHAEVVLVDEPAAALRSLSKLGYTLVTTSSHTQKSLFGYRFPDKVMVVVGNESDGVSSAITKLGQVSLCIPGTKQVESLNVSVATAVILSEWFRQKQGS